MVTFLYCQSTEGGMDYFTFSGPSILDFLPGWMRGDCIPYDQKLVDWLSCAEVGEVFQHRLGVVIRLQDGIQLQDSA